MNPHPNTAPAKRPAIITVICVVLGISGTFLAVIASLTWMGEPVTRNSNGIYAVNPLILRTMFGCLGAVVLGVIGWLTVGLAGGKWGARVGALVMAPFIPLLSMAIAILGMGGQHFEAVVLIVQFGMAGLLFPLCLLTIVLLCLPPATRYLSS